MKKRCMTFSGAHHTENPCLQARVLSLRGLEYALISVLSSLFLVLCACEGNKIETKEEANEPKRFVEPATFAVAFESVEEMSKKVMTLVEQEDAEGLEALRVTEDEFKRYVWPQMPASGGASECDDLCEYAWKDLNQKSHWHLKQTLARYGGERYVFLDTRFDGETTEYGTFKVHRYPWFLVRDEGGEEKRIRLMGSIIETDNRFSLLSYIIKK